jgi:hypothetical protein
MSSPNVEKLKPLVVRPRFNPLESVDGYLIRIAEANRYPTVAYFVPTLTNHGSMHRKWFTMQGIGEGEVEDLAARLNVCPLMLKTFVFGASLESWNQLGAMRIDRKAVWHGSQALCPDCVVEKGYASRLWEVAWYTVCHRHERRLLTRCPECQTPLSAQRGRLLRCRKCDADLTQPRLSAPVSPTALKVAQVLAAGTEGREPSAELTAPFGPLCGAGITQAVDALGLATGILDCAATIFGARAAEAVDARHDAVARVAGAFEDWPNRWYAELTACTALQDPKHEGGLRNAFRRELMAVKRAPKELAYLRSAFALWLLERYPIVGAREDFDELTKDVVRERPLMTTTNAATLLGTSSRKVLGWARKGLLVHRRTSSGTNEKVLLDRQSVDAFKSALASTLTCKDVAEYLGTSTRTVPTFVEEGLLMTSTHPVTEAAAFSVANVENLVRRVESAERASTGVEDISIRGAVMMVGVKGSGEALIVRGILEGRLRVTAFTKERGIRSLRVDLAQVRAWVAHLEGDLKGEWLTSAQAAERMGIKQQHVIHLCARGQLIARKQSSWGSSRWRIHRQSCEAFAAGTGVPRYRAGQDRSPSTGVDGGVAIYG